MMQTTKDSVKNRKEEKSFLSLNFNKITFFHILGLKIYGISIVIFGNNYTHNIIESTVKFL